MYRSYHIIQTIFFCSLLLLGCEKKISEVKTKDVKVEVTKKVRIVSLAPNITEFLFALGVGDQVVGVTKFCNYPKETKSLPKVGGLTDTNFEAIIALKPSLVVGVKSASQKNAEKILKKAGIESLWLKVESVEEVLETPKLLAKTLGLKNGQALSSKMREALKPIDAKHEKLRPRVLVIFGTSPFIAAGPGTYMDELIRRAGGINVIGKDAPAYPQLDSEKLIFEDPAIIIDASFGKNASFPDKLSASENHTIFRLKNLDLMRPSPRIGLLFDFLKKKISENPPNK